MRLDGQVSVLILPGCAKVHGRGNRTYDAVRREQLLTTIGALPVLTLEEELLDLLHYSRPAVAGRRAVRHNANRTQRLPPLPGESKLWIDIHHAENLRVLDCDISSLPRAAACEGWGAIN